MIQMSMEKTSNMTRKKSILMKTKTTVISRTVMIVVKCSHYSLQSKPTGPSSMLGTQLHTSIRLPQLKRPDLTLSRLWWWMQRRCRGREVDGEKREGGKGYKRGYPLLYQGLNSRRRCKDSSKPIAWVVKVDLEARFRSLWHNIIQACIRKE